MKLYRAFALTAIAMAFAAAAACGGSTTTPSPQSNVTPAPGDAGTQAANQVTVTIPDKAAQLGPAGYGTNPLVVTVGTTVTWMNGDSVAHTVTSDTGAFDSGRMDSGATFSYQFNTAGTYPYHCTIHGAKAMSGVVQVNP
jgi:plastocyanin